MTNDSTTKYVLKYGRNQIAWHTQLWAHLLQKEADNTERRIGFANCKIDDRLSCIGVRNQNSGRLVRMLLYSLSISRSLTMVKLTL